MSTSTADEPNDGYAGRSVPDPAPLVHIGFHKCGSTWLQERGLGAIAGLTSTRFLPIVRAVLHELMEADDQRYSPALTRATLVEYTGRYGQLAVTEEALCGSYPGHGGPDPRRSADRLHAAAPEARILVLVRRQTSIIPSMYAQYVRLGGSDSYDDFVDEGINAGDRFDFSRMEYDRLVARYAELFGDDAVLVLPYELLAADPRALLERVSRHCGAGEVTLGAPVGDAVNAALAPGALAALRAFNRGFRPRGAGDDPGIRSLIFGDAAVAAAARFVGRAVPAKPLEGSRGSRRLESWAPGAFELPNRRLQQWCPVPLADLGYFVDPPTGS